MMPVVIGFRGAEALQVPVGVVAVGHIIPVLAFIGAQVRMVEKQVLFPARHIEAALFVSHAHQYGTQGPVAPAAAGGVQQQFRTAGVTAPDVQPVVIVAGPGAVDLYRGASAVHIPGQQLLVGGSGFEPDLAIGGGQGSHGGIPVEIPLCPVRQVQRGGAVAALFHVQVMDVPVDGRVRPRQVYHQGAAQAVLQCPVNEAMGTILPQGDGTAVGVGSIRGRCAVHQQGIGADSYGTAGGIDHGIISPFTGESNGAAFHGDGRMLPGGEDFPIDGNLPGDVKTHVQGHVVGLEGIVASLRIQGDGPAFQRHGPVAAAAHGQYAPVDGKLIRGVAAQAYIVPRSGHHILVFVRPFIQADILAVYRYIPIQADDPTVHTHRGIGVSDGGRRICLLPDHQGVMGPGIALFNGACPPFRSHTFGPGNVLPVDGERIAAERDAPLDHRILRSVTGGRVIADLDGFRIGCCQDPVVPIVQQDVLPLHRQRGIVCQGHGSGDGRLLRVGLAHVHHIVVGTGGPDDGLFAVPFGSVQGHSVRPMQGNGSAGQHEIAVQGSGLGIGVPHRYVHILCI